MAKKKPEKLEVEEESKEKRTQVLLDPEMARMIRVITADLDMSMPEYVFARLKEVVEREYGETVKRLGFTIKGAKGPD